MRARIIREKLGRELQMPTLGEARRMQDEQVERLRKLQRDKAGSSRRKLIRSQKKSVISIP
jgi:hypothetical protein